MMRLTIVVTLAALISFGCEDRVTLGVLPGAAGDVADAGSAATFDASPSPGADARPDTTCEVPGCPDDPDGTLASCYRNAEACVEASDGAAGRQLCADELRACYLSVDESPQRVCEADYVACVLLADDDATVEGQCDLAASICLDQAAAR